MHSRLKKMPYIQAVVTFLRGLLPTKKEHYQNLEKSKSSMMTVLTQRMWHKLHEEYKEPLQWNEFVSFVFTLMVPLNYWVTHVTMVKKWGAFAVIISNFVTTAIFSMPLLMIYVFMGYYSRKSYIRFWNAVPFLKGTAYSIALHSIVLHIFDVSLSGIALLYLPHVIRPELPWKQCKFKGHDAACMETFDDLYTETGEPQHSHTLPCCNERWPNCSDIDHAMNLAKYAPLDFYKGYMLRVDYENVPVTPGIIKKWAISVIIIWVLICILMISGINRFRRLLSQINQAVLFGCLPTCLIVLYFSTHRETLEVFDSDFNNLYNITFWMETACACMFNEIPGEIIAFSSLSNIKISIAADVFVIYVLKIIFMLVITALVSHCASLVLENYNISNSWCVEVEGDSLIFALIPEALQRWPLGHFWLFLYFITIFYWGFSVSLYVCNAFMDALAEEVPVLMKMRVISCVVFCIVLCVINIFLLKPNFIGLFREHLIDMFLFIKPMLFLASILGILLYSIARIKTDYYFMYGEILPVYCAQGVKLTILLFGAISAALFISLWNATVLQLVSLIILLPIPIGMIIVAYKFFKKTRSTLFSPDPTWGSPSYFIRNARNRYDSTYDLRHGLSNCTHRCLRKSDALVDEVSFWNVQTAHFLRRYHEDFSEENTT